MAKILDPNSDDSNDWNVQGNDMAYPTLPGGDPTTGATNTPTGGGGGGGGYSPSSWGGVLNIPTAHLPGFNAPRFAAPSMNDAMNDPGFQFRLASGREAMDKSAAAKGTLRTGGHFKDLLNYGQSFASQEYANVYNRALQSFDRNYRAASDEYAPTMARWRSETDALKAAALGNFQAQYDAWALGEHNKAAANAQENSILAGM